MMQKADSPLIVGAGPVGLAAALFLMRHGIRPRLVDLLPERSPYSKALAVNPRTLEILEASGITQRMLELGKRVTGARFHRGAKTIAEVSFEGLHPKYPFMLALSQATTESLLADALQAAGGAVERGTKLVEIDATQPRVAVILQRADGAREPVQCAWVLATDGAHSTAREQLRMEFPGSTLPHPWYLADAPLVTKLPADRAHVFFFEDGAFLFLLPVIDAAPRYHARAPVWRVLGNRPHPLTQLIAAEQAGAPVWESTFHVPHRIVNQLSRGAVYFAGDAAHIHSPVGARGMNLGIEDAWVFAELATAGRLGQYDSMRRRIDARVVHDVALLSSAVDGRNPFFRFARSRLLPLALNIEGVRSRIVSRLTGLDHPLPLATCMS